VRYAVAFVIFGQDIAGDWQGTLKSGKTEERLVVTLVKDANGGWAASEAPPDDGSNPVRFLGLRFENLSLRVSRGK
jgi:hypothetical protein